MLKLENSSKGGPYPDRGDPEQTNERYLLSLSSGRHKNFLFSYGECDFHEDDSTSEGTADEDLGGKRKPSDLLYGELDMAGVPSPGLPISSDQKLKRTPILMVVYGYSIPS